MPRSSSLPDRGSVLIETVAVASLVFLVVMAAVSATIEVSITGTEALQTARGSALHAARHGGLETAIELAGGGATVERDGDLIRVVLAPSVIIAHPDGARIIEVVGRSEVPLAPFRSDRG